MAKTKIQYYATGRRKESTARVFLRPGTGRILINKREIADYFPRQAHQLHMMAPLLLVEMAESFDAVITVKGGGHTGQSGAIRHGLARALCESDANLRPALKKAGMMRRDAREVERKKYGQPGARKAFQFSKR
jgi:small subunit ribosomal protein S9